MKRIFADTSYWVAIFLPTDENHQAAKTASGQLGGAVGIVTSDAVLVEYLNHIARCPPSVRERAIRTVRNVLDDPNVDTEHFTHRRFVEAVDFYEARSDKEYSLTDCMSMCIMKDMGIREVLTNDHHFEQEGFTILMP